jgi:hypothetical protein
MVCIKNDTFDLRRVTRIFLNLNFNENINPQHNLINTQKVPIKLEHN